MDTQTSSEPVAVKPDKAPIDWTGIALFIVLTFGLSWVIWPGLAAVWSVIHHTCRNWYVWTRHRSNNSPPNTQGRFW